MAILLAPDGSVYTVSSIPVTESSTPLVWILSTTDWVDTDVWLDSEVWQD